MEESLHKIQTCYFQQTSYCRYHLIQMASFLKSPAVCSVRDLIAKLRMIGFDPSPELGQEESPDLTEYGFISESVEFPELKQEIEKSRKFYSVYGK